MNLLCVQKGIEWVGRNVHKWWWLLHTNFWTTFDLLHNNTTKEDTPKISESFSPPCAPSGWGDWCYAYILWCSLRLGCFSYSVSDSFVFWTMSTMSTIVHNVFWTSLVSPMMLFFDSSFCTCVALKAISEALRKHLGSWLEQFPYKKYVIQRLLCTGQEKGGDWKNIACLLPLRKDRSGLRNRNIRTMRIGVKLGHN